MPESSQRLAWTSTRRARLGHLSVSSRRSSMTDGYDGDPRKLLTAFPTECHGGANCELAQVVEGPIPFAAMCEHRALPFTGQGLHRVRGPRGRHRDQQTDPRLVRVLTRRFGVQERRTHQIADGARADVIDPTESPSPRSRISARRSGACGSSGRRRGRPHTAASMRSASDLAQRVLRCNRAAPGDR